VAWPLWRHRAGAGHGRFAGGEKAPRRDFRHLPTHGPLFVALLIGTVLLIGLLNYVPALALGPVVEHLLLWAGPVRLRRTTMSRKTLTLFDPTLVKPAIVDSFKKLDPRLQWRNPVMFVVYVGSLLTTVLWAAGPRRPRRHFPGFILAIALWLWFTVLFANFAEALAEGRSKAQAASLRGAQENRHGQEAARTALRRGHVTQWPGTELRKGDVVLVEAGDMIPGRRRSDRRRRLGGRKRHHRRIRAGHSRIRRRFQRRHRRHHRAVRLDGGARVTVNPGEAFLDRMIAMVEGAKRQKTPNEIALTILLVALTIVFLGVTVTLLPFSLFSVNAAGQGFAGDDHRAGGAAGLPDSHHDRRIAVGHRRGGHEPDDAGQRDRHVGPCRGSGGRRGRAAAGQDRHHHPGQPAGGGFSARAGRHRNGIGRCRATRFAGGRNAGRAQHRRAGQTAVQPARARTSRPRRDLRPLLRPDPDERRRPGRSANSQRLGRRHPRPRRSAQRRLGFQRSVRRPSSEWPDRGSTPLVVADGANVLGVIELKDIVKGGIKERFAELRRMGIKTVMITGDNR
jgi:K+-transporting ATPase ATPase B chain